MVYGWISYVQLLDHRLVGARVGEVAGVFARFAGNGVEDGARVWF